MNNPQMTEAFEKLAKLMAAFLTALLGWLLSDRPWSEVWGIAKAHWFPPDAIEQAEAEAQALRDAADALLEPTADAEESLAQTARRFLNLEIEDLGHLPLEQGIRIIAMRERAIDLKTLTDLQVEAMVKGVKRIPRSQSLRRSEDDDPTWDAVPAI